MPPNNFRERPDTTEWPYGGPDKGTKVEDPDNLISFILGLVIGVVLIIIVK